MQQDKLDEQIKIVRMAVGDYRCRGCGIACERALILADGGKTAVALAICEKHHVKAVSGRYEPDTEDEYYDVDRPDYRLVMTIVNCRSDR